MKNGFLGSYFLGAAAKVLTAVEANPRRSNQHELGTNSKIREFLGTDQRLHFQTTFIYIEEENSGFPATGTTSYYDSREGQSHRTPEWRIYYPDNSVTEMMEEGDTVILALRPNLHLVLIVVPQGSAMRDQLLWLFGLNDTSLKRIKFTDFENAQPTKLDFLARYILEECGVELEDPSSNQVESLIERFGYEYPKTKDLSELARTSLPDVDARDDPDEALLIWLAHEEAMFRCLESKIVSERIERGFIENGSADVDAFVQYSLSVQNRRKSRMGYSLENHISAALDAFGIQYTAQARTRKGKKPDFLFPSLKAFEDTSFDTNLLTHLAAKSTCKDRWSQILSEADRIPSKHLLTLEPAISESTTDTMCRERVSLIVPSQIQTSYTRRQRKKLLSFASFIEMVKQRAELATPCGL